MTAVAVYTVFRITVIMTAILLLVVVLCYKSNQPEYGAKGTPYKNSGGLLEEVVLVLW